MDFHPSWSISRPASLINTPSQLIRGFVLCHNPRENRPTFFLPATTTTFESATFSIYPFHVAGHFYDYPSPAEMKCLSLTSSLISDKEINLMSFGVFRSTGRAGLKIGRPPSLFGKTVVERCANKAISRRNSSSLMCSLVEFPLPVVVGRRQCCTNELRNSGVVLDYWSNLLLMVHSFEEFGHTFPPLKSHCSSSERTKDFHPKIRLDTNYAASREDGPKGCPTGSSPASSSLLHVL